MMCHYSTRGRSQGESATRLYTLEQRRAAVGYRVALPHDDRYYPFEDLHNL
jgi:hypothetical protein